MNEELQGIVERMIAAGESEEDIALVIREYKPPQPPSAKPSDPSLGDIVGAGVGAFNRGVASLVTEPLKLGGAIQRTIAGSLGYPENVPLPMVGGNLEQLGEQADKFVKEVNPYYENVSDTGQAIGEGLGQAFSMVGAGMASAGGKVLAPATQATGILPATGRVLKGAAEQMSTPVGFLGGTVTAVPEWEAAKAAGMSDEDAFATMVKNYFVGQTDAIPISNFLSRFNKITGGALLDRVKNYGVSGLQEFVQEGFQTYLTNQIAKSDYDPDRDPMFQVLESAQIGGIVGLLFPVMGRVMAGAPPKVREKLEQKAVMMEADKAVADMDTGDPAVNATIDNQADEATNTTQNAVQEQETTEIPVREEAEGSQAVREGNAEVSVQTPTGESQQAQESVDPVTLTETTFPVYDEQGNDTGKTKKAHQFTITLPGVGDAKGTIVGDKASILEIFAEKDAEGNAKRGGGLYGKVIENLKRKGVKQIVVGLQSPASTAALQGMVRKGTLSVAPGSIDAGETDMQGNPIRFNIESDLVTEFDQTGALLGGAEESRAATKSAATEQIADFLRGKVKSRGEVTDFADSWNLKHPERPITDAEVKTAWDLIRVPKPSKGETMTLPINELLKDQIKTFYRGVGKGVRKGQKLVNETLIPKVQEALKAAKLSPRQTSAILARLKGTNLFTPGSASKLNAFIDRVVADAEYAEKLGVAKRGIKKIKKRIGDKKNTTVPEQKAFSDFLQIDPQEVADIDEYGAALEKILDSGKPVGKGFKATPLSEVSEYTLKELQRQHKEVFGSEFSTPKTVEKIVSDLQEQKVQEQQEELRRKLFEAEDLTEEEIDMLLSSDESIESLINETGKREKIIETLREYATEAKTTLPQQAEPSSVVASQLKKNNEILTAMKEVDLSLLTPDQLKLYIKAISKINVNNDFGGLGNFEAIATAQKNFRTMQEKLSNSNILSLLTAQAKYGSLPQITQAVFGGITEDAAVFQLYMGITGVSEANSLAVKSEQKFLDVIQQLRKQFPQAFTDDSKFRRGIYKALISYEEGVDPIEALQQNKELIEQDIQTFKQRGDTEGRKNLEELYKPFRDASTIEDVTTIMKKVDPLGLRVAEAIINHYRTEGMAQKVKDYNFYYFNDEVPEIVNYGGERRWVSIGAKGVGDFAVDPNDIRQPDIRRAGKPKQTRSAHRRNAVVAKDKEGNILPHPDNKVMNYNMDGIAADHIRQTVFEIEAIPHMVQVRENANRKKDLLTMFGWKAEDTKAQEKAERIYKALFDQESGAYFSLEKSSLGKDLNSRSEFDRNLSSALSTAREIGYAATLSGPSQVLKQSTVLSNVLWKLGKDADLLSLTDVNTQEAKEFLAGRSVSTREQQSSIFNIGDTVDLNNLNKQVGMFATKNTNTKWRTVKGWLGGLKFLTKTDSNVAQISYLAFYKQYLKKNGLKFRGWTEEKALENEAMRKEAHAYAKQRVDVLQTVSNPQEQAAAMKDGRVSSQLFKVAVIPFGTFGLNQRLRLVGDLRAMIHGNSQQRKAAVSDFAATAVEVASFSAVSSAVRIAYGAAMIALAKSFGLLGEDDEEFKGKLNREWQLFRTRLFMDMLPTILAAPEQVQTFLPRVINYATFYGHNLLNPENKLTRKQFEEEVGMPLYAFEGRLSLMDQLLDVLGVYGRPLDLIIEGGSAITEKFDDESKLTEPQKDFALFVALLSLGSLSGAVPSDVRYALNRELSRQKRKAKDDGQNRQNTTTTKTKSFKRKQKTFKRQ